MNIINVFNKTISNIGMKVLEQPVFYQAPIGIRFEIGGEEDVYIKRGIRRSLYPNSKYVNQACERAIDIFNTLPKNKWLVRIDVYDKDDINKVRKKLKLKKPQATVKKRYIDEDDKITHYELYWDLNEIDLSIERIIKEVVLADIGGLNSLASAVFLLNPIEQILYHLYDDRGLDVVAKYKKTLLALYEKYGSWVLKYDREKIDALFKGEGTTFELKNLLSFLNELEKRNIYYKLDKVRDEAIMIEVSVLGQRWEVEFLDNGSIDVEKFKSDQDFYDEKELEILLKQFFD